MPRKGDFKTVEQYTAEATRTKNGCLIMKQTGEGCALKIYRLRHGPVPKGLQVCHTCDAPRCMEDAHHWLGTQKENMQDAAKKGRMKRSEEQRRKIGDSKRGNTYGRANKGKKRTAAVRAKMSASRMGTTYGKGNKGKPKSKKHRRNISKASHHRITFYRLMSKALSKL